MLSLTSALRMRITSILIFCGACALLLPTFRATSQQAGQGRRIVDDKYSYSDCPVKIIGIETSKHQITMKEVFLDDDDWMKGLRIRVKNESDKIITHVGIGIHFDRPPNQSEQAGAFWELWYGVSPFHYKPQEDIPPPIVRVIQPGETELIPFSEREYDALKAFLAELKFPSSVEKIHVSVYTIGFADGTAWSGQLYRRDPKSETGWRPADKPQGSVRNRTAFSFPFLLAPYKVDSELRLESIAWNKSGARPLNPRPQQGSQCGKALVAIYQCPKPTLKLQLR
jgi:hypothetical protein